MQYHLWSAWFLIKVGHFTSANVHLGKALSVANKHHWRTERRHILAAMSYCRRLTNG